MSVLFAYPGQGAQRPGMLAALPDEPPVRACLEQAADCLGQAPSTNWRAPRPCAAPARCSCAC